MSIGKHVQGIVSDLFDCLHIRSLSSSETYVEGTTNGHA